jgi:hypothetical protein
MCSYHYWGLLGVLILCLTGCGDAESTTDTYSTIDASHHKMILSLDIPSLVEWARSSEIKLSLGDSIELCATLENEEGEGIADQTLYLNSTLGNSFSENNPTTDQDGQISTILVAVNLGKDRITVKTDHGLSATLDISIIDPEKEEEAPNLPEIPGVLSWALLGKVTVLEDVPIFHKEIEALQGKLVKIQGFITPLEKGGKQTHFLLSTIPPKCSYCPPSAGPESTVEVYSQQGIEFSSRPIIVSGKFQLLHESEEGLFYRVEDAHQESLL